MKYEKIKRAFQKQPSEFLQWAVTKLKDDIGEAIARADNETVAIARKQLRAVKDILLERC